MATRKLITVILAAGEGTRMKSDLPKVLHPLAGRSLLDWVIDAAEGAGRLSTRIVVTGRGHERLAPILEPRGWRPVVQRERRGTGHALRIALKALPPGGGDVLVLNGDTPLITAETLRRLVKRHRASGGPVTLAVATLDDPHGYGRICRDAAGRIAAVAEQKSLGRKAGDCREINPGFYVFDLPFLRRELPRLAPDPVSGEYYLTELVAVAHRFGNPAATVELGHPAEAHGVNSQRQLAEAGAILRRRIIDRLMDGGVTVVDPAATYVDAGVRVGRDTVLLPGTILEGETVVGEACRIGPWSRVAASSLGRGVEVRDSSVVEGARIADGATIGPFARLRPGSVIGREARVGNFVELKKSRLGPGRQGLPPHLPGGCRGRPGGEHRRRHHHLQLRRRCQAPDDHRRGRLHRQRHVAGGPGRGWAGRRSPGPGRSSPGMSPRAPWGWSGRPQVNLEGWAAHRRSLGTTEEALMCGIIGYFGGRQALPLIVSGMEKLAYRGYDSAGVALVTDTGLYVERAPGKIAALKARLGGVEVRFDPWPGAHPLGHPRASQRGERPPPHLRPLRRGPQRHHRELPGAEAPARGRGARLPLRDRHRGGGPPDQQPLPGRLRRPRSGRRWPSCAARGPWVCCAPTIRE